MERSAVLTRTVVLGSLLSICLSGCGVAEAAEGLASYYTAKSCAGEAKAMNLKGSYWGALTANGERFDESALTCALPWKPDGREYMVYSAETDKAIVVRHNDKGPGLKPRQKGVIIDLTPAGWKALGFETLDNRKVGRGHINVSVMEVR